MKKKLILSLSAAMVALCTLAGCGGKGGGAVPDTGEFDLSKVIITGADENVRAELGTRYIVPVPEVEYNGRKREVTFEVFDSTGAPVEIIARGTRFFVESTQNYTIRYYITYLDESKLVATSTVSVSDLQGPEILLPASAYNMMVYKDSVVEIPEPTVRDASGTVAEQGYKVTFKGTEVPVTKGENGAPDTFSPTQFGEYIITYTAKDASNNVTEEPVTVNCARMVTLCDFENGEDSYAAGTNYVTEHVFNGEKALEAKSNGEVDYQMIAAYVPYYNLAGFDRFAINVWSSRDCTASNDGFYLLNQIYRLREGNNIIVFDREAFASQYPGSQIPSSLKPQYATMEYIYFQICGNNLTVVVDNFVGIYDNAETDTVAPVIDFGKEGFAGSATVDDGKRVTVPTATVKAYDNSVKEYPVTYTVKKKDGTDITEAVKAGTFRANYADEAYTVTYSATDDSNNTGTRDFTITVRALVLPEGDDAPADRAYTTLQSFDEEGCVTASADDGITLTLGEMSARKNKAMKMTNPNKDGAVFKVRLLKDGNALTAADLKNYAYLQVSVVSDADGVNVWLGSEKFTLQYGLNKLYLSAAVFADMMAAQYDAEGWLTCKLDRADDTYNIYLDQFLAVAENETIYRPAEDYDLFQNFDRLSAVDTMAKKSLSVEHADEGVSVKAEASAWQVIWVKLLLDGKALTADDWKEYDHLEFVIYASGSAQLYFRNTPVASVIAGRNVLNISIAHILEQIEDSKNDSILTQAYRADGWSYWQFSAGVTVWLDNLYGVYPAGQTKPDPEDPDDGTFDPAKVAVSDLEATQTVELGERYTPVLPTVKYNGADRSVTFKVFDKDGAEVELKGGKFTVESMDGYTVKYYISFLEEDREVATATVAAEDTVGPVIEVTAPAMAEKGVAVTVPEAQITDLSGVKSQSVKVTFGGADVTVTEGGGVYTFTPEAYGDYEITYTAADGSDNQSTKTVTIPCVRTVLLNDFENGNNSYVPGGTYVTEHAKSGNGLQASTNGATEYKEISTYVDPYYDLSGFDRFVISVWSSRDCLATGNDAFYLKNRKYALKQGDNQIVITRAELLEQFPNGKTNTDANGRPYITFQICGENLTVVVDLFKGIFDNFETDTAAPTFDFGRKYRAGAMDAEHGKVLVLPVLGDFNVYDNSMTACTLDYTVKKADGTDITEAVKAGTFTVDFADGSYNVVFTATDASGNETTKNFTVNALQPAPERKSDVLQAFETGMESSISVGGTVEVTTDHAVSGNCVKWTISGDWQPMKLNLKKDGNVLTEADFNKYEYLEFRIYCDKAGAVIWSLTSSVASLDQGENIVRITTADFLATWKAQPNTYNADGWLFLQMNAGTETVNFYIDSFIGVYPADAE